jgi:phospholipid/cholesterol/gamma-HCH transport system substrate-binding protein/paraquat-inducible protein B
MSTTRANYVKVGVFVLTAAALAIAGAILFGAGTLFKKMILAETYLDESVQGLDVGSPVKHRGVKVGTVKEIHFAGNQYPVRHDTPAAHRARRYVRIVLALENARLGTFTDPAELQQAIREGLRIRAASQGVTGILYLNMDYADPKRARERDLPLFWEPELPYIPSSSSTIAQFTDAVQKLFVRLETLDLEGIASELQTTLRTGRATLEAVQLPELRDEALGTLRDLRATNQRLQKLLDAPETRQLHTAAAAAAASLRRTAEQVEAAAPTLATDAAAIAAHLNQTLADGNLDRAAASLAQTLQTVNRGVLANQPTLAETLENLRQASAQLNELLTIARDYPSLLLFGTPPPATALPPPAAERRDGKRNPPPPQHPQPGAKP